MPDHVSYATPEEREKYGRMIPNLDHPPNAISRPDAYYPHYPRKHDIMGTVIVRIVLSQTGEVEKIKILEPHPLFDASVVHAVTRWRYEPLIIDGTPKRWGSKLTLRFRLQ